MIRWPTVDVAKGIAIVSLAFGIAFLWLVDQPHTEGFLGTYREARPWPFWARTATMVTPPTFFVLSGVVIGKRFAELQEPRAQSQWAQHLFTRGLFLVLLELVVTQLYNICHPGPDYVVIAEVLTAFGWSFVIVALGHRLGDRTKLGCAVALWLLPELWWHDGVIAPGDTPVDFLRAVAFVVADHPPWQVEYPVAGWLGFILVGMVSGKRWSIAGQPPSATALGRAAVLTTLAFVVIRFATSFGSLGQASPQNLQQFVSPTKYPVSAQFALLGLAGAAAVLALSAVLIRHRKRGVGVLAVLGRQPLMAFLLIKAAVAGVQVALDVRGEHGDLESAAVVALLIVVGLVPVLAAYERVKRRARSKWVIARLL